MATNDLLIRILAQDLASGKLTSIGAELRGLGTDAVGAGVRIRDLERQMALLEVHGRRGTLTVGDMRQWQAARAEIDGLKRGIQEMSGETVKASAAFGGLGSALASVGIAVGAGAILRGAVELTRLAASAQQVETIFYNLAESSGINADAMLADMKRVSSGTMAEADLMVAANRAIMAGGAQLAEQMPRLFQIARAASLATGNDISYVFETLVKGIIRASPLLIDNAEIYIKVGAAVDDYAASLGKTTEELSAQERQFAVMNAVLAQGATFVDQMGIEAEGAAEQVQSLGAAWQDVKVALGDVLIQMGVAKAMGGLADMLSGNDATKALRDVQRAADELPGLSRTVQAEIDKINYALRTIGMWGTSGEAMTAESDRLKALARGLIDAFRPVEQAIQNAITVSPNLGADLATRLDGLAQRYLAAASSMEADGGAALRAVQADIEALRESAAFIYLRFSATSPEESGLYEIDQAVRSIQAQSPILLDVEVAEGAMNRLKSLALGMAGIADTQTITGFYEAGIQEMELLTSELTGETAFQQELLIEQWLSGRAKAAKAITDSFKEEETATKAHANTIRDIYQELSGDIQSALTSGMQPTELDFLLTATGNYEDAPLEAVRRLDAIIARGMEEIKAHPDWAAMLAIPPDVMAQGGDALKAWAIQTRQAAAELTRPDLIDWDAFVREYAEGLQNAAAKEQTIKTGVLKLQEAGLITGTPEEQQAAVAKALGLSDVLSVPVSLDVDITTADMTAQIEPVLSGLDQALATANIGARMLASWQSDVQSEMAGFRAMGADMGTTVSRAFVQAMRENVGGMLGQFAALVAPPVAELLRQQGAGGGSLP